MRGTTSTHLRLRVRVRVRVRVSHISILLCTFLILHGTPRVIGATVETDNGDHTDTFTDIANDNHATTTVTDAHSISDADASETVPPLSCVIKWPSLSSIEMPENGIEPAQLMSSYFPDWAPDGEVRYAICSNSTLFDPDGILPSEAFNRTRVTPDRPRRVVLIPWFSWAVYKAGPIDLLRQFVYTMSTVCNKHTAYTRDPSHSTPLLFSPDDRLCDVTFILLIGTDWWTASETFETWLQRELGRYYEIISESANGRYLRGTGSIGSFLNSYAYTEYNRDESLRQCPHITRWYFGGKYRAPVLFIEDGLLKGEMHNVMLLESNDYSQAASKRLSQLQQRMLFAFEHV